MVETVKEYREPSTSERFGQAFSNLGQTAAKVIPEYLLKKQERQEENEAAKRLGIDITGLSDQKMRQDTLATGLKGKFDREKSFNDEFLEKKSYDKIKGTFGEKFADIWKAAPTGGKTELLKHGIDAISRGDNLEELLNGVDVPEKQSEEPIKVPQLKNGKVPSEFEWPDYSKRPTGYNAKDWADERKTWRKENSPVFLENKTKLQNSKRDALSIKKIDKLNKSKKVAEGFERSLINPSTGEPYGVAQIVGAMSPETQEWIKEIARFQNRAKDAFGSRVTNFDLVSYMKQFPGLMNTPEGRDRIIKMMTVNNELDQLYENALQNIYQKYGLSGIPQEEADKLAQKMIEDESSRLYDEYLSLDEKNQNETSNQLSGKMIDVIGPDGEHYEVDQSELDQLPEGFRIV
jgi:hypothetical protein